MRLIQPFAAALVLPAMLWVCANVSSVSAAEAVQVASVEGITEYRLENGLRFLLFPDQSNQQITVNIIYDVGSRHEGYGETGMAHLLEHLLFKGSTNHPDIPAELSEHGGSYGGQTWFDRTSYDETFPASEENLAWALDLEADRMVNSFIAAEDLESEMTVVRNEWEKNENNPGSVLLQRVLSSAFLWHNYGNTTIGARSDIENVPIDRLQGFYRKYYQPDNAVLVIAGRFDPERAVEQVEEKFGPIPRPDRSGANKLFKTYTAEPAQDGERTVTLRRVGDVQIVTAAYHIPGGLHEQFAAAYVLGRLLDAKPAGRLYRNLVEPGLAAGVGAEALQLREPGVLIATAVVREEDSLRDATDAMLATLQGVVDEPPTEEEVRRAKAEYAVAFESSFNKPETIALELKSWVTMGDWRLMFLHRDRMEQVTPEDVLEVARAYLLPSNRTIGYFYPTDETPPRAAVPESPDVAALVTGYAGREAIAQGEAFDPTPENIDRRTRTLTLSNDVEVALLPKQNRGDAVRVNLMFRHGAEQSLMGKSTSADFAGSMLMRGTTKRSRQEIEDELDRLKLRGSVSGGALLATGKMTTVRKNLPAALRLYGEILREPAFDSTEFELLRENALAGIEASKYDPIELAKKALGRHLNSRYGQEHVHYVPTFEEQIVRYEAVTLEEARDFWASFYGAEGGTIAIVGDFDPDEIVSVLEEVFGHWTAKQPFQRVEMPYQDLEKVAVDIETPDKTNAVMLAGQVFRMRDDHTDFPAMLLANHILGAGSLHSRLGTRIRGKEGLSYTVGSQFDVAPPDEIGQFSAFAIFAPENADKVMAAFREEMVRALESGFTAEEVTAAKRSYLDGASNDRVSDSAVASMLANNLFLDRTMAFTAQQEAAIEALTPADIHAALRRYIDLSRMSIFRAGDFANKLVPVE